MRYLTWRAEQAHDTLVKGGARRCDADEIYQLILDGQSFEDAICNYALGWLRDEVAEIWKDMQSCNSAGCSLSYELVHFMVAFVADEEIEKMRDEIMLDHEWVDDLVWHRLFAANTWVSYDDHVMWYWVYTGSDPVDEDYVYRVEKKRYVHHNTAHYSLVRGCNMATFNKEHPLMDANGNGFDFFEAKTGNLVIDSYGYETLIYDYYPEEEQ